MTKDPATHRADCDSENALTLAGTDAIKRRIVPAAPAAEPGDVESASVWGFRDTAFSVNARGHVELSGSRYALSGHELPDLLPWTREVLAVDLHADDLNTYDYPPPIPEPRHDPAFEADLQRAFRPDQLSSDPEERLRHGHGHSQEEMYSIKYDQLERVPDLVVSPEDEAQIERLVALAAQHGACLIPYGGGTNVTDALRCPAEETRAIVSVDMRRMNRVLWIDPANHIACIEAGANGREIQQVLGDCGFTIGHEPDSYEFSTLGGWIATHASGMKKNRYGNIEEIVLDVRAVTPLGVLEHHAPLPRESIGTDVRKALFGSEGGFGIVTSAVVKIFAVPEVQKYGSVLFRNFEEGVAFLRKLMLELGPEHGLPASVRLVDNLQFQFSQVLKPTTTGWRAKRSALEKWYVTGPKGFDPKQMVACTLVFEGSEREVEYREDQVYSLARQFNGMKAGSRNGERGYQLTFGIAYIRDFMMNHYILAESFETTVPWSEAVRLCENVKQRIWQEHAKRGLSGKPFVTCRVTQLYDSGVCIYFYFAYYFKGVENPSEVYAEMERAARDEILQCGGSLSHHHGIGKLRQRYLPRIQSAAARETARRVKEAFDPDNVFGVSNQ